MEDERDLLKGQLCHYEAQNTLLIKRAHQKISHGSASATVRHDGIGYIVFLGGEEARIKTEESWSHDIAPYLWTCDMNMNLFLPIIFFFCTEAVQIQML